MEWYWWVAVTCVALWLLNKGFSVPQHNNRRRTGESGPSGDARQTNTVAGSTPCEETFEDDVYRIAGITYRCKPSDVGGFFGTVEPEPSNPHDPEAMAVYRDDGKHLGYIPVADGQRFRTRYGRMNSGRLHLVGVIAVDAHVPIYGKVLVLPGVSLSEDRKRQEAFMTWIVDRYGKDFYPCRFECPL